MSAGMLTRLKALVPRGWFPDEHAEVVDGVLGMAADAGQHGRELIDYARAQTRIKTASDGFLDLVAYDFFGVWLRRLEGETDQYFRTRIIKEILRPRVTRAGIIGAVQDLTGLNARIIEPFNPADCGGYNTGYLGWSTMGRWGSIEMPYELFLGCLNPLGAGIPNTPGYNNSLGGLDAPPSRLAGFDEIEGPVTVEDIYATINASRAAGITVWAAVGYPPEAQLDNDFLLDASEMVGP